MVSPASTKGLGQTTNPVGHPLREIFASDSLVRVLSWLLMQPQRRFGQRELVELTGARLYSVQRELARLERTGLVLKEDVGKRRYYSARQDSPVFNELRSLFIKAFAFENVLHEAAATLSDRIELAFIYGSLARGDEREGSDVDVFVVGDVGFREAVSVFGRVRTELDREVNVTVHDRNEFAQRVAANDLFTRGVLEGPKIWLIGNDETLAGMAEQRGSRAPSD